MTEVNRDAEGRCKMRGCNLCDSYRKKLEADKWIPCEERLPSEENRYYLIFTDNENMLMCQWTKRGWNTYKDKNGLYDTDCEIKNVIAWQPLPAPYKKEGAEDE